MSRAPDVIVVGAGIVGAACAFELARAGLRVVVLEREFAGGGTTAAGMGHLVVMDDSDAQFALTSWSCALWRELADQLSSDCELDRCGTLWLAEDEEQLALVRAKHEYYAAHGVETEILDARSVAEAEPELKAVAGALRVAHDAVVYPPAVARWFMTQAILHGAVLQEECAVVSMTANEVATADGARLSAGLVVNAAGAAAPMLTAALPVMPRKGHLAITDRYQGFLRHQLVELGYLRSAHVMTASSVAFNLQPRITGQVLIGSSRELVDWDASLNRDVLGGMLARATSFVPRIAELTIVRCWTGFRPATADKLPLIGRTEDPDGPWVAAGHEGLGITTATGTARLLTDLILDRTPFLDPAPFAASRALAGAAA